MKLAHVVGVIVFATTAAFANDQTSNPSTPTAADVKEIVRLIVADKTKIKAYCALAKLYKRIAHAEAKNDMKTAEALDLRAQALLDELGPDYAELGCAPTNWPGH
jgi:hypothetical protein